MHRRLRGGREVSKIQAEGEDIADEVLPEVVEGEAAEGGESQAGLTEVLAGDVALPAPLDTQAAPHQAAGQPGDPQPHLELPRLPALQSGLALGANILTFEILVLQGSAAVRSHQVYQGSVETEAADAGREEDDSEGDALQTGNIEEWLPVFLTFILLLNLPLDTLEVEDGSSLRVVETGRPVEQAQYEGDEDHACHSLKTDWSCFVIN